MTQSEIYLNHLSLTNFRKFSRLDINLPRRLVLFVGDNAQGKTSVLEAIYYLATYTSLQSQSDRQLINFCLDDNELAIARLVGNFSKHEQKNTIEVRLIVDPTVNGTKRFKKEILVEGVKRTAQQAIGSFYAVLYLPQMTKIIEGGPEERRRYINLAVAQAVPGYGKLLSEYSQIVAQRNALLKQIAENKSDQRQLQYWNEMFADRASRLFLDRYRAIIELEKISKEIHFYLTHGQEEFYINYQPAIVRQNTNANHQISNEEEFDLDEKTQEDIYERIIQSLQKVQKEEIIRGVSVIGPHRDEIRFLSNEIDLGIYGSRGQIRTALLTLKLSEKEWLRDRTSCAPILLLDEVLAELDVQRRTDLFNYLIENGQVLITTTDLDMFSGPFIEKCSVFRVTDGIITEER